MGNACCSDSADQKHYDPSLKRVTDNEPTSSKFNHIKFGLTTLPQKHPVVDFLNDEAGSFSAKNAMNTPSGTASDPRALNDDGMVYFGEWHHGYPHGKGEMYFPNGSYYTGYMIKGKPSY